ncbi:MAG: Dam family site-specific DNA-(adenine-N6)-methyltransferase [Phenylobacterium sp.]|nr:Dam family site-specific DNA-(adenine-N6)-methyltransferase [Phenylobacterium sp.]
MDPFLKWAGGKRWLMSRPEFRLTPIEGRYIEPFLGGGASFFHLQPSSSILSDLNAELIELYGVVRDHPEELRELMWGHQRLHSEPHYYSVRAIVPADPLNRAARFLYLNRTCFNGLYRVNLRGEFNVPKGTKSLVISEDETFIAASNCLKRAELRCGDFESAVDEAVEGDFLFIDPPYTVKHNVNGFVKYNEQMFRWEDQTRLRDSVVRARRRGARILMTNADHASLRSLYEGVLTYSSISRNSVLASASANRGPTTEAILSFEP